MTANKNYPIGVKDFKTIVSEEYIFIDKTLLVKEIMEDKSGVILITRPRRFGKTMGMSILEHFLKLSGDTCIFKGLKISDYPDFCSKHQNKYPVIFLSFKDIKPLTFSGAITGFQGLFSEIYKEHDYVLEGDLLDDIEKEDYLNIRKKTIHDPGDLAGALKN